MKSNWDIDIHAEQELAKFLDYSFYDRLVTRNGIETVYKRYSDINAQYEGFDVLLAVGSRKFLIDEKAS
jgi:hypothetical protein